MVRPVFKIGGGLRRAGHGGFDSHPLPPFLWVNMTEILANEMDLIKRLRAEIGDLFLVEDITSHFPSAGAVRFRGRLLVPTQEASAKLRSRLAPYELRPIIRRVEERDVLVVLPEVDLPATDVAAPVGRPWVNVVLFVATVFSVMLAGMQQSTGNFLADLFSGWPFAAGLLITLLTHEFGHYFAAQYHGVAATLPYFIPMPLSVLGTFGAVINVKAPMRDRRALLDIGAAGPLAGLIVALPVLLIGLALSPVESMVGQCTVEQPCWMEGNSLLYLGAKFLIHGRVLPGDGLDVMLHPLAFAGWAGILVTALNLLPVGTLDGGHIAHALLGDKARYLLYPILLILVVLGTYWNGWWLWAGMLFVFGRRRARPLDDTTPLDGKRKAIAVLALVVFVLTFTPLPLIIVP